MKVNTLMNFIGSLIRDIIVQFEGDKVKFKIKDGKFVYKSWIPFHFGIGNYLFLPSREFYETFGH